MSQTSFKEFGLKYIEEMAKGRERSKKEVSVTILDQKNIVGQSSQQLTYSDFENFVENTRNNVIRIFDGEFTKLTIQSLSKMKQIISKIKDTDFILGDDEIGKNELLKAQNDVVYYFEQAKTLKLEKEKYRTDFEIKNDDLKNSNKHLEEKIRSLELNEKKLYSRFNSLEDQIKNSKEQLKNTTKELNIRTKTLEELVQQKRLQEKDLQIIETNVDETLASTEAQYKKEIEEIKQITRNELTFEYELTINDLENRLEKENDLRTGIELKIKEFEKKNRDFEDQNENLKKDYKDLKDTIDISSKTLNFIQSMLSNHPLYSSIMILANLGGSLPLDTLAKSVGAAPLRLRHLLEELVERELIEISYTSEGGGENPTVTIIRDY